MKSLNNKIVIVIYHNTNNQLVMVKRGPTSINIDQELWREVKKAAIDQGITATEFLEDAIKEKLKKHPEKK